MSQVMAWLCVPPQMSSEAVPEHDFRVSPLNGGAAG